MCRFGLCTAATLAAFGLCLSACQSLRLGAPEIPESELEDTNGSLAVIAAELQMHLRDDTYRYDRATDREGRNVFAVTLWRLERLREARGSSPELRDNAAVVIEYARARALERLRRYPEALAAYDEVVGSGSVLGTSAGEARDVVRRFARNASPPDEEFATPEEELRWIDGRVEKWNDLAWEYRRTTYDPLAREELEAWEVLRVEWYARHASPEEAIEACHRLIEQHHLSKLYPRHLLRLGDLYADAARAEYVRYRTHASAFDAQRYQQLLDRAFAAYEMASRQRNPDVRNEADGKISALLAYHQGVRADAP